MGFLTVIMIRNDALSEFKEDPTQFGKAILDGVDKANKVNKQVSCGFTAKGGGMYANHIDVEPSRHADHHTLFLLSGNGFSVIGKYEKDWEELIQKLPDVAHNFYERARNLLKWAKESLPPRVKKGKKS